MKRIISQLYTLLIVLVVFLLIFWSVWEIFNEKNSKAAEFNSKADELSAFVEDLYWESQSFTSSLFVSRMKEMLTAEANLKVITIYSFDTGTKYYRNYDSAITLLQDSSDSDKGYPVYDMNEFWYVKLNRTLNVGDEKGMDMDLVFRVIDNVFIKELLVKVLSVLLGLFILTLILLLTVFRKLPAKERQAVPESETDSLDSDDMLSGGDDYGFSSSEDNGSDFPLKDDVMFNTEPEEIAQSGDSSFYDDLDSILGKDDSHLPSDTPQKEDLSVLDHEEVGSISSRDIDMDLPDFDGNSGDSSDDLDFSFDDEGEDDFSLPDMGEEDDSLDFSMDDMESQGEDDSFSLPEEDSFELPEEEKNFDVSDETEGESFLPEEETAQGSSEKEGQRQLFSPRSGFSWEDFLMERLNLELERAASFNQDLTLAVIRDKTIGGSKPDYDNLVREIKDYFTYQDLIFEWKDDGFVAIIPNSDLDDGIKLIESFIHDRLNAKQALTTMVGLSSRNGRLISSGRLLNESLAALNKATDKQPLVGFRSDPIKYRNMLDN